MGAEHAATDAEGAGGHRGKLYSAGEESEWCTAGTGLAYVVDAAGGGGVARLRFRDEDSGELIHDRPLFGLGTYRREGDAQSIIVWEDPETLGDWALSFQDPSGAADIWQAMAAEAAQAPKAAAASREPARLLPLPTLGKLDEVGRALLFVPPREREPVAVECASPEFVAALRDAFHTAEDLDDEDALAGVFRVVKGIFLLSNQRLSEQYLGSNMYEDVMGMLEHDDGLPAEKRAAHRHVLQAQVSYRSVLPLEDAGVLERIHLNFRLGYLKDVALPRLLDDSSLAALTQMIHSNLSAIVDQILRHPPLLSRLLELAGQRDVQSLLFLQDICRLARVLPPPQRQALHDALVERGLLSALLPLAGPEEGSPRLRSIASEVLLLIASGDASALRRLALSEGQGPVLGHLIRLMLTEDDQGVQSQVADVVRATMDVSAMEGRDREGCLDALYGAQRLDALAGCLKGDPQALRSPSACFGLQLACELLAFAVANHGSRAKLFVMRNGIVQQAAWLMAEASHSFLRLAPVRLLRAIAGTKDDAYSRYLVKSGVFGHMLRMLQQSLGPCSSNGNLFTTAVLELMDFIRVDNVEVLVEHLAGRHGAVLRELSPRLKIAAGLLLRHSQNLERQAAGLAAPPGGPEDQADEQPGPADAADVPAEDAGGDAAGGAADSEAAAEEDAAAAAGGSDGDFAAAAGAAAAAEAETGAAPGSAEAVAGSGAVPLAAGAEEEAEEEACAAEETGEEGGTARAQLDEDADEVDGAACAQLQEDADEEGSSTCAQFEDAEGEGDAACVQFDAYGGEAAVRPSCAEAGGADEEEGVAATDEGVHCPGAALLLAAGGGAALEGSPKLCAEAAGGEKLLGHARKRQKTGDAELN